MSQHVCRHACFLDFSFDVFYCFSQLYSLCYGKQKHVMCVCMCMAVGVVHTLSFWPKSIPPLWSDSLQGVVYSRGKY